MYRIREVRESKGITQSFLAVSAQVSQPYLSDLEHNRRGAKQDTIRRIAEVLGVPVEELKESAAESA